ncbi:hypothetical protein MRS76_02190 [Rhizobiaceae bacterium n13]|uniref:Uncharacterized protein n=1 Tax=Ferirhizobium litorale TaxID=2927786 RepID=A0AAE3QCK2_9HYPH|nr:hypothetical protein [Fererhizobium litorale]MDI7860753.1 hypothetical protein [Fererhizobium litorale]MDI7920901.1 hypothetical protein [Fererhizobium litorale]
MRTADHSERTKTDRNSSAVPDGLRAAYKRHQKDEWRTTIRRLEALRQSFAEQRREVLSPKMRDRIVSTIKSERQDPRGPGLRYQSLVAARDAEVDLAALRKIHDRAHLEFRDIVRGTATSPLHEVLVGHVYDVFKQPPLVFTKPDPDKETLFYPPFHGSWDRFEQNQASGDGAIAENSSYLDGWARMGSKLVARNHDASDVDLLCAYRESGYLVEFKTLRTGILQVKADLSALVCRHHISTEDEWGWSDFHAITRGRLVMAVFWNWEDVDPANEVSHQWFVSGLDCSGDGESFPGTSVQAFPGERRIINLFTDMAFPAGRKLWIYVGVSDRIWAFLNDVSIDISIDSAWLLNSLAIRSI